MSPSGDVCVDPSSPCRAEARVDGRTGGTEIEDLLIVLIEDIFAACKHLPVLVDLVFGVEIDPGVGVDLTGLAGAAVPLGDGKNARLDQPPFGRRDGERD